MYYVGTSVISKNLGITNREIYDLIRKKVISRPRKRNGRFQWSESNASEIVKALSLSGASDPLTFSQGDIRYLGNKAEYSYFLRDVAARNVDSFETFADYFAGSGGAEIAFADKTLILNDILTLSYTYLKAWYMSEDVDNDKIKRIISLYNSIDAMNDGYVTKNYAGSYFGATAARKIDYIRDDIKAKRLTGKINEREEAVLLVSLVQAMNKAANTYSNYDSHRKPPIIWKPLELEVPRIENRNRKDNRIFNTDANVIAPFNYSDVTYLDFPEDSRQYCDIYHLTENVVTWKKPELNRKTLKPQQSSKKSLYSKKNALKVLEELLKGISSKLILVDLPKVSFAQSSRNVSKISMKDCFELLQTFGSIHVEFPPMETRQEQLYLMYEFKKDQNIRESVTSKGGVIVLKPKRTLQKKCQFPINFAGDRNELNRLAVPFLPDNIETLHLIGAEGMEAALRSQAKRIELLDERKDVREFVELMFAEDGKEFMSLVTEIIKEYGFSDTDALGYEHYGVSSEEGLLSVNRDSYNRLRKDYHLEKDQARKYAMFYILLIFGYHRLPRYTKKKIFSPAVGKRDFNAQRKNALEEFFNDRHRVRISVDKGDLLGKGELSEKMGRRDLLYIDLPTNYDVEQYGTLMDEDSMEMFLNRLELLDRKKVRYCILYDRTFSSERMESWIKKGLDTHRVIEFDESNENNVLIINY
ncbi:MAG: DNA adenine methylase [Clostridia bacterium]|nr:DNA adenine methylase [Clostridia bacterium]